MRPGLFAGIAPLDSDRDRRGVFTHPFTTIRLTSMVYGTHAIPAMSGGVDDAGDDPAVWGDRTGAREAVVFEGCHRPGVQERA
jgi:hypothetical protein